MRFSRLGKLLASAGIFALLSLGVFAAPSGALARGVSCSGARIAESLLSPQAPGGNIIFTGSSTGCSSPQYEFMLAQPSGAMTTARSYESSATWTWNTAGEPAGNYTVELRVRAPRTTVAYQSRTDIGYVLQVSSVAPSPSGIYMGYSPKDWPSATDIAQFKADAGKNPAIINIYEDWEDTEPPPATLAAIHANGSTPMLTWQPKNYSTWTTPPYPLAKIAAGAYDAQIRQFATAVKNLGYPVFLRPAHEMNDSDYPWVVGTFGQTAADFVNAWRHMHDVYASVGATNVIWVWSPDVYSPAGTSFASIYPGDAYVDWLALDGYNNIANANGWRSFTTIFSAAYQAITVLSNKPVMIAETASSEANDGGAMKAAWITDTLTKAIPAMSRIQAICWFNVNEGTPDWQIESSLLAETAFRAAVTGLSPTYASTYPR